MEGRELVILNVAIIPVTAKKVVEIVFCDLAYWRRGGQFKPDRFDVAAVVECGLHDFQGDVKKVLSVLSHGINNFIMVSQIATAQKDQSYGKAIKSTAVLEEAIISKIYLVRGRKVMLDFDLAQMHAAETKQLERQVRRKIERFPANFYVRVNLTGI